MYDSSSGKDPGAARGCAGIRFLFAFLRLRFARGLAAAAAASASALGLGVGDFRLVRARLLLRDGLAGLGVGLFALRGAVLLRALTAGLGLGAGRVLGRGSGFGGRAVGGGLIAASDAASASAGGFGGVCRGLRGGVLRRGLRLRADDGDGVGVDAADGAGFGGV